MGLKSRGYSMPTIDALLKEAANKQAGEEIYEVNKYFAPSAATYDPMNFTQRTFDDPVDVLTRQRRYEKRYVRTGPGLEYERVTLLEADVAVQVIAMTDSGKYGYRWFQVRYVDGQTGYMLGDALRAQVNYIEGMM